MIKDLNNFIYFSKYSKQNALKKESFEETIDRVFNMHVSQINSLRIEEHSDYSKFCEMFMSSWENAKKGYIYGSQRALQFGGNKILDKNCRIFNCSFSYCDRIEFFGEFLWILLCGCGAGYSVHTEHVNRLPKVKSNFLGTKNYVIEDSIEGWADAIHELMKSYFNKNEYKILFDYSSIRPKGSPISGGWIAPGPDGLKKSIENISAILESAKGRKLRPIECYSINCHLTDAVLSGGVRRAASSAMFDPNDEEMRNAKTGDWFVKNPHFARSNNSATILRTDGKIVFDDNFEALKKFGEPGFAFVDDIWTGYNPCFEISFDCRIEIDGTMYTGWQMCNLATMSGKDIQNEDHFYKLCEDLATLGTIQASYNQFPYLGEVTEALVKRDALLGCSISGIMTNADLLLRTNDVLANGAQIIKDTNKFVANVLGINQAKRTTCIKPKFGVFVRNDKFKFHWIAGNTLWVNQQPSLFGGRFNDYLEREYTVS